MLYLITSDISARFLRGQHAYLIERGYTIHVGTSRSPRGLQFDDGVVVHHIGFEREPDARADLRAFVQTLRLIRSVRPDIVNASTPKAGLIGMVAAWLCRVRRRVHVVRGFRYETMAGRRARLMRRLEGLSIRLATDVTFNSASLMEVAERDGLITPGRGRLLGGGSGNGVDVGRFHGRFDRLECRRELGIDESRPTVGFIGRLTADKGVPDLIRAFDLLAGRVPDVQLVVIGDYEEGSPVPRDLRDRIRDDPAITHLPWSDAPERTYPAFDVVAFPSYREGLPNVVMEAQASGVPVAGYDATGTRDAVSDEARAFLVPTGDAEALARALATLLTDEALRDGLIARNREWVAATFSQERIWSDLERIYASRS